MTITARAHSNIALIKYWGKADTAQNMPAVPSLSMTLDSLFTETSAEPVDGAQLDEVWLNGSRASAASALRITRTLDRLRHLSPAPKYLKVVSHNNFPTAAGLASSASGFAALVVCANEALSLGLTDDELSNHARQSSASAGRSIHGGYVQLELGQQAASPVSSGEHFPLSLLVAVTATGAKDIGSTEAMLHTQATSPYYPAWVSTSPALFEAGRAALLARDLKALGEAMEQSTLMMHSSMLAARPGIAYFNPATVEVMHCVKRLRSEGLAAYFTMDAGPHVKVLAAPANANAVEEQLKRCHGVTQVLHCRPGPRAQIVNAPQQLAPHSAERQSKGQA